MGKWARRRWQLDKLVVPEPRPMTPEEVSSLIERTRMRMLESKQKALHRARSASSAKRKRARQAHARYLIRQARITVEAATARENR